MWCGFAARTTQHPPNFLQIRQTSPSPLIFNKEPSPLLPYEMSDRENLGAGIYAGLSAFLVLLCLIGAFVLPRSILDSKWLGIPALAVFLLGIPILLRIAHRSRIRDAVAKAGGTVLRIKRLPFWQQR